MGGYWYIEGANGWHYCYSKEPTFTCPVGSMERLGDILETACGEVGIDPEYMLRRLRHSSHRARVNDRLTDRCANCGHRLERLGFRCWIERPYTEEELTESSSARVTSRLQEAFGRAALKTVNPFYVDTKREAEQWARDEVRLTKAIKEEQDAI